MDPLIPRGGRRKPLLANMRPKRHSCIRQPNVIQTWPKSIYCAKIRFLTNDKVQVLWPMTLEREILWSGAAAEMDSWIRTHREIDNKCNNAKCWVGCLHEVYDTPLVYFLYASP